MEPPAIFCAQFVMGRPMRYNRGDVGAPAPCRRPREDWMSLMVLDNMGDVSVRGLRYPDGAIDRPGAAPPAGRKGRGLSERPIIVGLAGRAGSGKTTAAAAIVARHPGFRRVRFADPIKRMCRELGLTDAQVDGDEKELPMKLLCGHTPRFAMQSLGTEWGRNMIGEGLWINALMVAARDLLNQGLSVVVDDVRFPNEVEAIRRMGGVLVRIVRPDSNPPAGGEHMSERLVDMLDVDHVVKNDGTRDELAGRVEWAIFTG